MRRRSAERAWPQRCSAASSLARGIDPARARRRCFPSSRTAPGSSGSPSGTRRPGRPGRGAPNSPRPARSGPSAAAAPTRCTTRARADVEARLRRVDHGLDRRLGHARVVLELHALTPLAVAAVAHRADEADDGADARDRPRAAPPLRPTGRSRSRWMRHARRHASAPGDRRKEGHLGAVGEQRVLVAQTLVERAAHRAAARQHLGMARAARDQRVAQAAPAWCRRAPRASRRRPAPRAATAK